MHVAAKLFGTLGDSLDLGANMLRETILLNRPPEQSTRFVRCPYRSDEREGRFRGILRSQLTVVNAGPPALQRPVLAGFPQESRCQPKPVGGLFRDVHGSAPHASAHGPLGSSFHRQ